LGDRRWWARGGNDSTMAVASKYAGRNRKADGSLTGPEDGAWAERLGLRVGYSDYWLDFLRLGKWSGGLGRKRPLSGCEVHHFKPMREFRKDSGILLGEDFS
jgi:hypothetical protein